MRVQLQDYPEAGPRFTEYTLSKMRELVTSGQRDPDIVRAARSMVRNCNPKDYYDEAECIFRWVKANIRYVRDPNNCEWLQSPSVTLREGQADCDCGACLLGALFGSVGLATGFEAIQADPRYPGEFSHVYAIVKTPKGWRAADWTVPTSFFGWRPTAGVVGRKIFLNQ
jgi:hypothetical protein